MEAPKAIEIPRATEAPKARGAHVASVAVICAAAITWQVHKAKSNERRIEDARRPAWAPSMVTRKPGPDSEVSITTAKTTAKERRRTTPKLSAGIRLLLSVFA